MTKCAVCQESYIHTDKCPNYGKKLTPFSDPEFARSAGRKGGQSVAPENRTFSQDRASASRAGKKGGAISKRPARYYVIIDGRELTVTEASKQLSLGRGIIYYRLKRGEMEGGYKDQAKGEKAIKG